MSLLPVVTRQIDAADLVSGFHCSDLSHTDFFLRAALALDRAGIVRTHVLPRTVDDAPNVPEVLGYYSLAAGALSPSTSGRNARSSPMLMLERFAVHSAVEGTGIASHLLLDAFGRCSAIAAHLGVVGVLATAVNPRSFAFASSLDFVALTSGLPCRMVIPMAKVHAAVAATLSTP